MASGIIDELLILMKANTEGVDEGMAHVENVFKKGLNNILKNFVTPLTAALGTAKLFNNFTQSADKISKLSKSLGINSEELQVWSEAAARAGGSTEAFQNTIRTLQRSITNASAGTGMGAAAFQRFGISVRDANGDTKDSFQILSELAAKAETMSKQQFVGLAQSLRLDQGTIQLLQEGSEGVKKLVDQQRQFGVYSKEDMEAAEDYNNAMGDFKQATQVAAAKIFSALLPPLNILITTFAKIVAFIAKNKAIFRGTMFAALAMVITTKVITAVKKLQAAMALKNFGTWAKLAALFTGLYLVIEDFIVWLEGGESALEGLWSKFGTAEEVKAKIEKLKDMFLQLFEGLQKHAPLLGKIAVLITAIGSALSIVSLIKKVCDGFKALSVVASAFNMTAWANPYVLIIGAIIAAIALLIYYWDDVTAAAQKCWDWMKNTWGGFADWFLGIWDKVKTGWTEFWDSFDLGAILDGFKQTITGWWDGIIGFFTSGWKGMIDGLLEYVPDWIKKRFMGGGNDEPDDDSHWYDGFKSWFSSDDDAAVLDAQAAAAAGISNRVGDITTNNTSEVRVGVVNVSTNDSEEFVDGLQSMGKRKVRSTGNSANVAYQMQTGTIGN